jgi:hypothetical protein
VWFGRHCCPDDWFAHLARQSVIDKVRVLLEAWRFVFSFVSLFLWLAHALRDALLTYCATRWRGAAMGCSLSVWLVFVSLHVVRFILALAIDAPARHSPEYY